MKGLLGPKRKEERGGLRKRHNELFNNFFSSPDVRVIKSKTMRSVHIGKMRNTSIYKIL
jgi:hypothetical protein